MPDFVLVIVNLFSRFVGISNKGKRIRRMRTYISILRGINVSGKNLIKMNSLQEMYEDLGFQNVKTYIQSGNVVFQSVEVNSDELEQTISDGIVKRFTANVPVLVLEVSELKNILEQNPFLKDDKDDISKLHITFLSESPNKLLVDKIGDSSFLPDEYFIKGEAIYLFCPNGYGKTKLSNSFFETKLKVKATTRNLRTAMELVKIGDMFEKNNVLS